MIRYALLIAAAWLWTFFVSRYFRADERAVLAVCVLGIWAIVHRGLPWNGDQS